MSRGEVSSGDAVAAAWTAAGVDLKARIPPRGAGEVPTVEWQWRWVVADAGIARLQRSLAGGAEELSDLSQAETSKVGRAVPRIARTIAESRDELASAIEAVGWFAPPGGDRLADEVDLLVTAANDLLEGLESALGATLPDPRLRKAILAGQEAANRVTAAITATGVDEKAPQEMVKAVFGIDPGESLRGRGFDLNRLRGLTALDAGELDELSKRMLGHLTLPGAQWPPSPIVHLSTMLLTERPLIAHRMALSTRDLVQSTFRRSPGTAVRALAGQRRRGQSQYAAYGEISTEIEALARADETGDDEARALATARLYAAEAEGPLRSAVTVLLELRGIDVAPNATLTYLRDTLRKKGSLDLSLAIEPEWRNAVDHRQFHWDPARQRLDLRGEAVTSDEVFNRYALGAAVVAGVECGIAVAAAASPKLLDRVDKAVPLHQDRVLVEHRLAQQLAAQGMKRPAVRTTPTALEIGPIARDEVVMALGAMLGCIDVLQSTDSIEVRFDGVPTLSVTLDALRRADRLRVRDGENNRVVETDAVIPIFVSGLLALGVPPVAALERGAEAACRSIAHASVPKEGVSRKAHARRIARAAKRGRKVIRETRAMAKVSSPAVTGLEQLLRNVERSASDFVRRESAAQDAMLADLRSFSDAAGQLPSSALPWFQGEAGKDPG